MHDRVMKMLGLPIWIDWLTIGGCGGAAIGEHGPDGFLKKQKYKDLGK